MAYNLTTGDIIDAVGGALVLAMGVAVFALRPRRPANQAFLLYAAGFAVTVLLANLLPDWHFPGAKAAWMVSGATGFLSASGVVWMARLHATGVSKRGQLFAAAASGTYMAAVVIWASFRGLPDLARIAGLPESLVYWHGYSYTLGINALLAASVYYVALAALADPEGKASGERTAVAASLWVYVAMVIGVIQGTTEYLRAFMILLYAIGACLALAWLLAWRTQRARTGRNMALWIVGLPAAFGVLADWIGPGAFAEYGLFGYARTLSIAIIAAAIMRYQILGFETKVRWTISRGTIAALFIAVFFVVSELAAELLGGTAIGPIAGIIGAGALVFFLAPLQRWADRLAQTATGASDSPAEATPMEAEAIYRRTAAAAWSDGAIDRKERALLDDLREGLGLSRHQAAVIESDVA